MILLKSVVQIATCPMPHMAAEFCPDCPGIGIVAVRAVTRNGRRQSWLSSPAIQPDIAASITVRLMKEIAELVGDLDLPPGSVSNNLIVNRDAPPFDNPDLRRAMALSLGLPSGRAEQAGFAVASGGGALRHRAAILLQFEQNRLPYP